ncbi:hypothetical protein PGB90_006292 [Kerria lacca]
MEATAIADALYSKIAIIPGGRDLEERPIIFIDAELSSLVANEQLDKVLKYFSTIFSTDTRRVGLSLIINAQKTSWRTVRVILQHVTEIFGTDITRIIVLRSDVFWDKQKVENCAKLKQNDGLIYIPISRLYKYVNPSHLPEELGGTWVYNHQIWIHNRTKVEGFIKLAENTVINLESFRHRLNNAKECLEHKITDSVHSVNFETYDMTKKATFKTISTGCNVIEQLEKQHTEQQHHLITVPQDIVDTKNKINRLLQIIRGKMTLVDDSWNEVQKLSKDMKEVILLEDGVCQVTNWILGPGEMLLNSQQNVGYDVVSAEDLRRNHETFELQCRKPYGHYAEILHKLDVLSRNGMHFPPDLKSQKDFMDFVCRSFATRVERRRNILITSARFFRLVSEITSCVYENLIMSVDMEVLETVEETLNELQKSIKNIDLLEKELVREGEKLSDLLSMPVKDAFGRELAVNYQNDIVNVQEILDMTIARRQLFKDSVELQKLTLQQVLHIRNYEKNAVQAIEWLDDLYKVMLKSYSHVGCSVYEVQMQKEEHQCFQETAKGTFEFGCQLLQAALALRQSCKLSEQLNIQMIKNIWNSWKKLFEVSQEQLIRLRVSAVFHRNVDEYIRQLKELTENFIISVVEEDNPKKQIQLKNILLIRENILLEVGRMIRLGRLLKTRLREPLCSYDNTNEINDNNETAINAISEKLTEVTVLAEQLDTTLCGFKFAVESEDIKKLLDKTESNYQSFSSKSNSSKNSPTNSSKSESNKSDEEFLTASECTGTPSSRASSFHTASEGELSPWWDIDPSFSSENEVETMKTKVSTEIKQTPEIVCEKIIHEVPETRKLDFSPSNNYSQLKETIYNGTESNKHKSNIFTNFDNEFYLFNSYDYDNSGKEQEYNLVEDKFIQNFKSQTNSILSKNDDNENMIQVNNDVDNQESINDTVLSRKFYEASNNRYLLTILN